MKLLSLSNGNNELENYAFEKTALDNVINQLLKTIEFKLNSFIIKFKGT